MIVSRLKYLFNNYIHNSSTIREEEELMELIAEPKNQVAVQNLIDSLIENTGSEMKMTDQAAASILQNILQKDKSIVVSIKNGNTSFRLWMRWVAVVILFLGAASAYWILNKDDKKMKEEAVKKRLNTIKPAENIAMLSTSDGNTILLDSIQNGTIMQNGSVKISKQGGVLIYKVSTASNPVAPIVYNTLSTPRGGKYQIILPDGSRVWLNAASSLYFPSAFTGGHRLVELTGEAYFEVAKNVKKPFVVKSGDVQVKVLGTHFNINAYSDENAIKTSLLEGSVKICKGAESGLLKPGEQALFDSKDNKVEIIRANMDEVMAWKNELFQFEDAGIASIMREVGRWYNVEIVYSGKVPIRRFEGKISRNAQLSEVLRILEISNVKFTVVGNTIVVQ